MKTETSNQMVLCSVSILSLWTVSLGAQTYDPASDFSTTANPGAVWSYGWSQTLGGTFHLAPFFTTSDFNFTGIDMWQGRQSGDYVPAVFHNSSSQLRMIVGTVTMQPGDLALHPGAGGEYSILRWTAPAAGSFSLTAAFRGIDIHPTTTDVHILQDSVSLFDGNVSALGTGPGFSARLNLAAGDTIDFVVGYGNDRDYHYDSTGLNASITSLSPGPVPETASTLWLLSGAIVSAFLRFSGHLLGRAFAGRRGLIS